MTGVYFVVNCLESSSTQFGYYVISKSFIITVIFVPICTMRILAQEKKEKTDQMLFTAPVSSLGILAGKYLATLLVVLLPVWVSFIYPLVMRAYGTLDMKYIVAAYVACTLVSLALTSIGMFVSSLVSNNILAAVLTYAVYAIILLLRVIEATVSSGGLYTVIHQISIYNKYNDMISGILRSGDILYMLVLSVAFFALAGIMLATKRVNGRTTLIKGVVVVILTVLVSGLGMKYTKVYDFTSENVLTLSDTTKDVVSSIHNPTTLYYMGLQSRANATYQELLQAYADLSDYVKVVYVNVETDWDFRSDYLSDQESVNEASILVASEDRQVYLDSADYTSSIQVSAYSYENYLYIENQLTSAVYYVNAEDSEEITMLTGCGEDTLSASFSNLLSMNNYETKDLNLQTKLVSLDQTFSDDTKLAVMNAPQTDYEEDALEELSNFVEDGGNLFVVLDPLNEDLPNLYAFLKEYGFDVQSGVVIESDSSNYMYDTAYYVIPQIKKTSFTEDIIDKGMQVLTMTSKGIKVVDSEKGYEVIEVLKTATGSFSKVDDFDDVTTKSDNDISGPFSVAAVAQKEGEGSVFLLTSDVFFNEDVDVDSNGANRKLFIDVVNQLVGKEDGIMIEGKEVGNQTAFYPTKTRKLVKVMTMVVVPVGLLLIGIVVLIVRYKNLWNRFRKGVNKDANQVENEE
jgi:ABC-2 type transport system permease protein